MEIPPQPERRFVRAGLPWAIAVVGAIIMAGEHKTTLSTILGSIAIVAATSNVVGGFLITDRMLGMFKTSRPQKP